MEPGFIMILHILVKTKSKRALSVHNNNDCNESSTENSPQQMDYFLPFE